MKNFAIIGVAGFAAPRHLQAIMDTGNNLVAALDKFDSVGILDSYFPNADFFTEFERFDRHLDKLRRQGKKLDYVSICTPNYLHDAHVRFALRNQADAICEKPLVLNPWNLDALSEIEKESGHRIYTVLQLRLHPTIRQLRKNVLVAPAKTKFEVDLIYVTSRGSWYHNSWKGDITKSGGVVTNIGIHFFDMLIWVFGRVMHSDVSYNSNTAAGGHLELERARVNWKMSIDASDLPPEVAASGKRTFRSIRIGNEELEFSEGFTNLHTESYQEILSGQGYGIEEARPSIELTHSIRNHNKS